MTKQWSDLINPFETGFKYGMGGYDEMTNREIEGKFPYYDYVDIIAFNEGYKDGRNGDLFRLNQGRENAKRKV